MSLKEGMSPAMICVPSPVSKTEVFSTDICWSMCRRDERLADLAKDAVVVLVVRSHGRSRSRELPADRQLIRRQYMPRVRLRMLI